MRLYHPRFDGQSIQVNGSLMVHHESGGIFKEFPQDSARVIWKFHLVQRGPHQFYPAVASGLIDEEWAVPHSQAGMAALFHVSHGTAESADEKFSQPPLGCGQVAASVHRAENFIGWHSAIEGGDEPGEPVVADESEDVGVKQIHRSFAPAALSA
jgi:hypothetical protein